jgi:hypothetical protein
VLHQDYIVSRGHDTRALEHQMWKLLDARGAECPAGHNVEFLITHAWTAAAAVGLTSAIAGR